MARLNNCKNQIGTGFLPFMSWSENARGRCIPCPRARWCTPALNIVLTMWGFIAGVDAGPDVALERSQERIELHVITTVLLILKIVDATLSRLSILRIR